MVVSSGRKGGAFFVFRLLVSAIFLYKFAQTIPAQGTKILVIFASLITIAIGIRDRVFACIAVLAMIYFGFSTKLEVGSMAKLASAIFLFLYLWDEVKKGKRIDLNNNIYLFLYGVIFFVSAYYNNGQWFSHDHQMLVVGIVLYLLIRYLLNTHSEIDRFLRWYIALMVFVLLIGLITSDYSVQRFSRFHLSSETVIISTANTISEYICVTIPMILYCITIARSRITKVSYLLILFFFVFTILMTVSRSGLIAMLSAFFLWTMFMKGSKKVVCLMMVGLLLVVSFAFLPPEMVEHHTLRLTTTGSAAGDIGRLEAARAGLKMIGEKPLFGVGPGNYSMYCYRLSSFAFFKPSHNVYLQVFAESGVIAGSLFMLALAHAFLGLINMKKKFQGSPNRRVALIPITLIVSLATMMVVSLFFNNIGAKSWFILLGCSEALHTLPMSVMNEISTT